MTYLEELIQYLIDKYIEQSQELQRLITNNSQLNSENHNLKNENRLLKSQLSEALNRENIGSNIYDLDT